MLPHDRRDERPPLAGGPLVAVWWADRAAADPRWRAVLDAVELARSDAYRRQADRDRFLVGALLVRVLAAQHLRLDPAAVPVDRTCGSCGRPHARPRVADDLHLSVSHAGECVVVAASVCPVGVDVEPVPAAAVADELRETTLGSGEIAPDPSTFITYWTRKEAVMKCTGDGLRVDLRDVRVSAPGDPPALLHYPERPDLPARTRLATLLRTPPGYRAALAVIAARAPVVGEYDGGQLLRDAAVEQDR